MTLLSYVVQQIEQFRSQGEEFAMQHADTERMSQLEEQMLAALMETLPMERLPIEKRLEGLSPEEIAGALSDEQARRLRELLDRTDRE